MEKYARFDYSVKKTDQKKTQSLLTCLIVTVVVLITLSAALLIIQMCLTEEWQSARQNNSTPVKTFRAGAYEQKLVNAYNATTREDALKVMRANLANMEHHAKIASEMVRNIQL